MNEICRCESTSCGCDCEGSVVLVFPCSGSADVGEIADHAGRLLARDGSAKMSCLVGIGGRISGIVKSAEAADYVVAIDGCPLACATKSFEEAGISGVLSISLADLDMPKGASPTTGERVERVASAVRQRVAEAEPKEPVT